MSRLLKAKEVAELLNVSISKSYQICSALKKELEEMNMLTIRGRVPEEFVRERYGLNEDYKNISKK